jgi:FKBP-type peptidyl-prolyl cis-trans isomerase FkpA
MKTIQSFFYCAFAIILLAACSGESFKKTKSGLLYKIISEGKGPKLAPGNFVKFDVKVTQKDSVSYNSFGKIPAFTMIDSVGRPYDISEVFPLLREGDSVVIVQSADSIAKMQMGQMPPGLKKGDKITISIRVKKVFTDMASAQADFDNEIKLEKEKEIKEVETYIKSKGINAIKTEQGTFVEIITPGEGPKADSGKQVSVKYTGMSFDGKKFDSNVDSSFGHIDPLKVVIGQRGSIQGFEDGLKQIAKGGKAKLYIPSMLGYGMQGAGGAIKPYENLIFEVEILDITDAPKSKSPEFPPAVADTTSKK